MNPSTIDDICVGGFQYDCIPSLDNNKPCHFLFYSGTCHPPSPLYISRAAAIAAGIPYDVPISVVNRLCSSGLMAIRNIAHAIQAKEISMGLAVGVESMSTK